MIYGELFEELKGFKHHEINFYDMNSQKMIKGFLKNISGDLESKENKFISIDIQEIKSPEDRLKKYSCKNSTKDENEKNNKNRLTISFENLDDIKNIDKIEQRDKFLYKLNLEDEELGIIVYKEK